MKVVLHVDDYVCDSNGGSYGTGVFPLLPNGKLGEVMERCYAPGRESSMEFAEEWVRAVGYEIVEVEEVEYE